MKLRRLSLREMWELYNILEIKKENDEPYLIDAVSFILSKISPKQFGMALNLMYGNNKVENGLTEANKFVAGLKENKFFEFSHFLRNLQQDE